MRKKIYGSHSVVAGFLALIVMLVSVLSGCGMYHKEEGSSYMPEQIRLVTGTSEIKGDPEALTRQDGRPLAVFSEKLMENALTKAREGGKENMVLSPLSAYLALMATACMGEEANQDSYAQVLGVPESQWNDYGRNLMRHMNWTKGDSCVVASNSLWLDDGASLPSASLMRISQHLYTKVYQGDLQSQVTMDAINYMVNDQTQGMIPRLRQEPYEEEILWSILNVVYLEAKWQQAFQKAQVEEKVFYTAQNEEITTLFLTDYFGHRAYIQQENWDGIVLPYRESNLAFVALRPMEGQTVDELLLSLTPDVWGQCSDQAEDTLMNFSMPKFTIEYRQDLTDVLCDMGLSQALIDLGADVSQTVKIQVDEEGTKAAAVTEVQAGGAMLPPEKSPLEIHFDHPFVYGIVDTAAQIPLFVGVMDRPVQ